VSKMQKDKQGPRSLGTQTSFIIQELLLVPAILSLGLADTPRHVCSSGRRLHDRHESQSTALCDMSCH
jgi:hypothetical protein